MIQAPPFFTGDSMTLQFFIKLFSDSPGIIVTYAKEKTFTVSHDGSYFFINFDGSSHNTTLPVEDSEWNMLTIAFDSQSRNVETLLVLSTGTPRLGKFTTLPSNPFEAGGTLAFGLWLPPTDSSEFQPTGKLHCLIDDIRIFSVYMGSTRSSSFLTVNVQKDTSEDLAALWKFDTKYMEFKDELEGYQLLPPIQPFSQPSLTASTTAWPHLANDYVLPFDPIQMLSSKRRKRAPEALPGDSPLRTVNRQTAVTFCEDLFQQGSLST